MNHPRLLTRERTVTDDCPACGASVPLETRSARVSRGTCPGCGSTLTLLHETNGGGMTPPSGGESSESAAVHASPASADSPPSPGCPSCGTPLTFQNVSRFGVEAVCSGCGTESQYRLVSPTEGSEEPPAPGSRAPRERSGFARTDARPCRECGGPLRFSTTPDGRVAGECASCGNRFTLPPRREGSGPPSDRFRRGPPRSSGGSYRPTRSWSRPEGRERPERRGFSGPRFRRRESRTDDDEDRRPPQRRRRPARD